MKRYYNNDNLEIDPIRIAWNKNNAALQGFHKPINKLHDDIIVNKLSLKNKVNTRLKDNLDQYNDDDISLEFLPKNDKNSLVPFSNQLNVTSYNNDKYRFKNMSQELMDKDEEIQKHKNEVYQLQIELNEIKKEKSKMISSDMENKLLKDKLNEHYAISRELSETKHNLKRELIDRRSNIDTIKMLKEIIHKQHIRLSSRDYESDDESEDGIESDYETDEYSEYSSDEEDPVPKKTIPKKPIPKKVIPKKPIPKKPIPKKVVPQKYGNSTLKNALLRQRLPSKKIDSTMVKMKITPQTKITKPLLTQFLNTMKK